MTLTVLAGAAVFDGNRRLDGEAVVVEDGHIHSIVKETAIPKGATVISLPGGLLSAGFVDAQVNGGGGVLLNNAPTPEGIATIAAAHRKFGTTSLMPTLISDTDEVTGEAIEAAVVAVAEVPGVLGLHLEGPHLAQSRKGAHLAEMLRPLEARDVDRLIEARERVGVLLVTVAPEMAAPELIRRLVEAGVIVSLGHSDADYDTARRAIAAGARGGTHLYNAMSQLGHRAPGMVGALLDAESLWCGIIADGFHVYPDALRIALRAKRGPGRLYLITDAMALVGASGNSFLLNGREVQRNGGRLTFPNGTLAGSDITLAQAVRFAVTELDVAVTEALRMASLYPAMFLGLDGHVGRIAPGFSADLVHLDTGLNVTRIWSGGTETKVGG